MFLGSLFGLLRQFVSVVRATTAPLLPTRRRFSADPPPPGIPAIIAAATTVSANSSADLDAKAVSAYCPKEKDSDHRSLPSVSPRHTTPPAYSPTGSSETLPRWRSSHAPAADGLPPPP